MKAWGSVVCLEFDYAKHLAQGRSGLQKENGAEGLSPLQALAEPWESAAGFPNTEIPFTF